MSEILYSLDTQGQVYRKEILLKNEDGVEVLTHQDAGYNDAEGFTFVDGASYFKFMDLVSSGDSKALKYAQDNFTGKTIIEKGVLSKEYFNPKGGIKKK